MKREINYWGLTSLVAVVYVACVHWCFERDTYHNNIAKVENSSPIEIRPSIEETVIKGPDEDIFIKRLHEPPITQKV